MSGGLLRSELPPDSHSGYRQILSPEQEPEVGMGLGAWILAPESLVVIGSADSETAVLAFSGAGSLACAGTSLEFSRPEWVETPPTVVHCCAGTSIEVANSGMGALEVLIVQTRNPRMFSPRYYRAADIQTEQRGKGILQETCHRVVRLVFDDSNGPPESNLVLGEVVNLAGRWSSYPPHSHPQPEIYYYRFAPSNGYGYGELGDAAFKVRGGDLLAITNNRSHCQVSAPGYTMYYLWAVRHLDGNRYKGFMFDPEHAWTLNERSTL